jgi:hypothetical protein
VCIGECDVASGLKSKSFSNFDVLVSFAIDVLISDGGVFAFFDPHNPFLREGWMVD